LSEIFVPTPDPGPDPEASPNAPDPWDDLQQQGARQIIGQRDVYARAALGILQAWVGFLMVVILSQITLRTFNSGLHDGEFIATITSTTASIIAFTFIVARYLFPEGGSQDGLRRRD
jgi:hypothetical protein